MKIIPKIKSLPIRLKMWWKGTSQEREIMLIAAEKLHTEIDLPLNPPLIKTFIIRNWRGFIGAFFAAAVALFIHFDGKPGVESEAVRDHNNNRNVGKVNHIKTPIIKT